MKIKALTTMKIYGDFEDGREYEVIEEGTIWEVRSLEIIGDLIEVIKMNGEECCLLKSEWEIL